MKVPTIKLKTEKASTVKSYSDNESQHENIECIFTDNIDTKYVENNETSSIDNIENDYTDNSQHSLNNGNNNILMKTF